MSDERPDRPGVAALAARLRVRRNAAVGLALAATLYVVRVFELLGPSRGTQTFPVVGAAGWFLMLAVVLAVSTAAVVAAVLTLVAGYRVVRQTAVEEPETGR